MLSLICTTSRGRRAIQQGLGDLEGLVQEIPLSEIFFLGGLWV